MIKTFLAIISILFSCAFAYAAQAPTIFYSDLVSGPKDGGKDNKGAFVTIWGNAFGAIQGDSYVTVGGGQVTDYPEWTDTKVCFQLGSNAATGNIVIHVDGEDSNSIPFTVRSGSIYFVTPNGTGMGTYADPCSPNHWYLNMAAGDIAYFREGSYGGTYGHAANANYILRTRAAGGTCNAGTEDAPIAFVGYPGETARFNAPGPDAPNFNFRIWSVEDNEPAWFTFSKLHCVAYNDCFFGTTGWRIVGNDCQGITRTVEGLRSGIIMIGATPNPAGCGLGRSSRILGNNIHGGRSADHFDHAIYVAGCPTDGFEIGWNHIYDNSFSYGPLVSLNMEADRCAADEYAGDYSIHDNIIDAALFECVGINVYSLSSEAPDPSIPTGDIYNNVMISCGYTSDNRGALQLMNGNVRVYHNTFINTRTYAVYIRKYSTAGGDWPLMNVEIRNNLMHMLSTADDYYVIDGAYPENPYTLVIDSNAYSGLGPYSLGQDLHPVTADPLLYGLSTGDYHLTASSPCRNAGSASVASVVTNDIDGISRASDGYDIGAYEYFAGYIPSPDPAPSTTQESTGVSSGSGGSGCFIATSVYGRPDSYEVRILEQFKERYLSTSACGRAFIRYYYKTSPSLVRYVQNRRHLKRILKAILRPVVWFARKSLGS